MPQCTVYIRNEDLEAWKALKLKSEFIHNALTYGIDIPDDKSLTHYNIEKIIKTKEQAIEVVELLPCRGQHYTSRQDCGRPNCPWGK